MKYPVILAFVASAVLAGCNPTPQQQAAINCGLGTAGGAAVGAAVGNQFGGGSGRTIMTAAGGAAGASTGSAMSC